MVHFKRLERLHSRFCAKSMLSSNTEPFLRVSLTSVDDIIRLAVQVYRILHKLSPPYLCDIFHYTVDVTSHTGRNTHRLFVPRVRANLGN